MTLHPRDSARCAVHIHVLQHTYVIHTLYICLCVCVYLFLYIYTRNYAEAILVLFDIFAK